MVDAISVNGVQLRSPLCAAWFNARDNEVAGGPNSKKT